MRLQISRDLLAVDDPHLSQDPPNGHLNIVAVVVETVRHEWQDLLQGQEDRVLTAVMNEAYKGCAAPPLTSALFHDTICG
jgi:hypothetical protein